MGFLDEIPQGISGEASLQKCLEVISKRVLTEVSMRIYGAIPQRVLLDRNSSEVPPEFPLKSLKFLCISKHLETFSMKSLGQLLKEFHEKFINESSIF